MLDNVKSKYILEAIFECMRNKKKLNILRFNKRIKKRLNITKEDYDKFILEEFNFMYNLNIDINIKEYEVKDKYITNKGLRYLNAVKFNNLNKLNLYWNYISDISILDKENYKELKELNLGKNEISDISILEKVNFNELNKLDLSQNRISDINVLEKSNLKKLKELNLKSNNISNISILNLPELNTYINFKSQ
jgi:Leucine-rich repeat (LRR) protein